MLQYLNCWEGLALCLALSQLQDDLHSHLSRQHGSLWRGGGGWGWVWGWEWWRGRWWWGMHQFCPLAAFLWVPGSETDTLTQEEVGEEVTGGHLSRWGEAGRDSSEEMKNTRQKGGLKSKLKKMQRMRMKQRARWGDVQWYSREGSGRFISVWFSHSMRTEISSLRMHLCVKHPDHHATVHV